jgi:hypothetical protein
MFQGSTCFYIYRSERGLQVEGGFDFPEGNCASRAPEGIILALTNVAAVNIPVTSLGR